MDYTTLTKWDAHPSMIFFIPSHDIEFTSHLNDYNSSNNLLGSHANGYYMNFVL